ncbi:MAG TPA: ring-cleaving dioxygenase [Candidatus Bathyarchaeia archaeon]|nr:ring-cleaving dioxygenase [Candidatus Bathyarchaeia archaeon]
MFDKILGLHHVTAISSSPQKTIDFYTGILGLRLVKLTVNYDDPTTYHLYFGDEVGDPGTILTFFPWPGAPKGRHGSGQLTVISLSIPALSLNYWTDRFETHGIPSRQHGERFGEKIISLADPDGQRLEIVGSPSVGNKRLWRDSPVPVEHSVRGFHSVTLEEHALEDTESLLIDVLGFRQVGHEGNRFRYEVGHGGTGTLVDILAEPEAATGLVSVGTVHHVAFRVPNEEEQKTLRREIVKVNPSVTPIIDRNYFHSIYFREPGGVLFEAATDPPGFTVDEPIDKLGTKLSLPPWLQPQRETIEKSLPKVHLPKVVTAS